MKETKNALKLKKKQVTKRLEKLKELRVKSERINIVITDPNEIVSYI